MNIIKYGNDDAKTILVQTVDEYDLKNIENEISYIKNNTNKDFCLYAFKVDNWNDDLSPWHADAIFGNNEFKGNGKKTLDEIITYLKDESKDYYIGGYSLAALFSLWAAFNINLFKGVAAASPSVWFNDFDNFVYKNNIKTKNVYLSLGDKEDKTKNQVMKTDKEKIIKINDILLNKEINTILEFNEGNHFKDADIRTAKAFVWLLNQEVK